MNLTEGVGTALALLAAVGVAELLAERLRVPAFILLVVGGAAVALVPGVPRLTLDPEVVLTLVIPPLLYAAALGASLIDVRLNARPIALLSVGLVLFTTVVVGLAARLAVPGLPLPVAFALGAVVAPPDAVSALAVGRSAGMPARLSAVIEGESLLNDATALTVLGVAVAAAVGDHVSAGAAMGEFLLASVGGAAVGGAVAWLVIQLRRRLEAPLVENLLSLATPFAAYLPAQWLHSSGVLAVVVCGLVLGHNSPIVTSSASRLQALTVWRVVTFALEGLVFALIGLQLPDILSRLGSEAAGQVATATVAVVLATLLARPVWVFASTWLTRRIQSSRSRSSRRARRGDAGAGPPAPGGPGGPAPALSWPAATALSWAGMRGVVTLAAAFSLPLRRHDGTPFPHRDEILFLAFAVVVVTLLGQGLSFGPVLKALGLERDRQRPLLAQANGKRRATTAALRRLDELVGPDADSVSREVAERLRDLARHQANSAWERLGNPDSIRPAEVWQRLRLAMIEAERASLLADRDIGRLTEADHRSLERELDNEEASLRG